MADGAFVPLATFLRVPPESPAPPEQAACAVAEAAQPTAEYAEVLRDIRLFRARLADALEAACAALEAAGGAPDPALGVRLAAVLEVMR